MSEVFRTVKNKNFTAMSNYHFKDKRISLKAKGLLSQILSLPDSWNYSVAGLASLNKEGEDAVRSALKELEKNGYVKRRAVKNKNGRFTGIDYTIYEYPADKKPLQKNPAAAKQTAEVTPKEKPTQSSTKELSTEKSSTKALKTDCKSFRKAANKPPEMVESAEDFTAEVKEQIAYSCLLQYPNADKEKLDAAVRLISGVLAGQRKTVRISGSDIPAKYAKERFKKLNDSHIVYVLECLHKNKTKVRNMKQYLLAALYNAPETIDSYYEAEARNDMRESTYSVRII